MARLHACRIGAPLLAAALLLSGSGAPAQTLSGGLAGTISDRDYIRGKLSFRYVATPNVVTSSPEVLDNAAIAAGTETGSFWTGTGIAGLQGLVRSLLQPPGRGGDANLQSVVARTLKIQDRPVLILLLNDVAAPLTQAGRDHWDACDDGHGGAWPCAVNASLDDDQREHCAQALHQPVPARRDATWAGSMTLGQSAFNGGAAGNPVGTFTHELVHTQDRSDVEAHMFLVSRHEYNYGSDGTHYTIEAMPNLGSTYQEGIADAVMMMVDPQSSRSMFQWFANNGVIMVEKTALAPGTGAGPAPCWSDVTSPSPDIWLYNQLHGAGVREVTRHPNPYPNYAYFRIRDLPPRFIVHNEMIIALVFSEYAKHLGLQRFMDALKTNDATLFRVCASSIAQLYDTICKTANGGGRPHPLARLASASSDTGPKPYLIPLAYADFFTGYTARTKEDYASIFENMLPREWIDLYWDGYKDSIRLAAPMSASMPPRPEELTQIAITLGVNQSTAEH